ncbi:MAG: nucleotide exchange factor GrpE, partial [Thermodesulfobacteriota bacterium]
VQEHEGVEENTVIKELLKGYTLHERILRPALVVVSKNPREGSGQEETSA